MFIIVSLVPRDPLSVAFSSVFVSDIAVFCYVRCCCLIHHLTLVFIDVV